MLWTHELYKALTTCELAKLEQNNYITIITPTTNWEEHANFLYFIVAQAYVVSSFRQQLVNLPMQGMGMPCNDL